MPMSEFLALSSSQIVGRDKQDFNDPYEYAEATLKAV